MNSSNAWMVVLGAIVLTGLLVWWFRKDELKVNLQRPAAAIPRPAPLVKRGRSLSAADLDRERANLAKIRFNFESYGSDKTSFTNRTANGGVKQPCDPMPYLMSESVCQNNMKLMKTPRPPNDFPCIRDMAQALGRPYYLEDACSYTNDPFDLDSNYQKCQM